MSLEALSRVASAAFPIFEREKIDGGVEYTARESNERENSGATTSVVPPPIPVLSRHSSYNNVQANAPRAVDWCRQISVEERHYIRGKIKDAYQSKTKTFEDLLEICCAIEEEFVFASAPSRLDYFKSGVQYEKRVSEKEILMAPKRSRLHNMRDIEASNEDKADDGTNLSIPKRAKTI